MGIKRFLTAHSPRLFTQVLVPGTANLFYRTCTEWVMDSMKKSVLWMCILLVTGCVFQGDKLTFETIARGESTYEGEDTLLFVATSFQDTEPFVQYTSMGEELQSVDYGEYIVVCAFLGRTLQGHNIEIKEVIRKGDALILLTVFEEPERGQIGPDYVSPFHVVKIRISEILNVGLEGEVSFLLEDTRGLLRAKVEVEIPGGENP